MILTRGNIHQEEKSWPQIYTILTVSLNSILGGARYVWLSPSMLILQAQGIPHSHLSYLAMIAPLSIVFICPFIGTVIDKFGRKRSILVATIPYSISLILTAIEGPLYIYYIARIFDGIGDAATYSIFPCYVAEISTPKIRGSWGNSVCLVFCIGEMIINGIGPIFSIRDAACILMIIPVVFLANYYILPESPYWLLIKERTEDARKSLQWLRGKQDVEQELAQLIIDVQRQQSETGRFVDLWLIESNRKAMIIVIATWWMQYFSGNAVFAMYTQTIFHLSGSAIGDSTAAMIYNAACFICAFVSSLFVDKIGRRIAIIMSCFLCSLILFTQGMVFYLKDVWLLDYDVLKVMPLLIMILFVMAFATGLGIVPVLLMGEMFSSSVKGKAYTIAIFNIGMASTIITEIFALFLEYFGLYAIFWFCGSCTLMGGIIFCFLIVETKGRTLEEIQEQIKKQ